MATVLRGLRRIALIAIWTVGATCAWILLTYALLLGYMYCQKHYGWPPLAQLVPDWVFWLVIYGGTLAVPVGAFLLGVIGRLPGTSDRRSIGHGFSVEPTRSIPQRGL